MQITRHWRLNSQRYRLEGVKLQDGSLSLQKRYVPQSNVEHDVEGAVASNTSVIRKDLQRIAS